MLERGQQIYGFVLEHKLGRGGFGEVWLARHGTGGQAAALKFIRSDLFESPQACQRFLKGGEAQASLDHPHIVRVWGQQSTPSYICIFMEYLPGGDLYNYLIQREHRPLEIAHALLLARQALAALGHAHQHGIVHRDVKTPNLLLANETYVKLGDFDLIRRVGRATFGGHNAPLGSCHYMSPEQIRDPSKVNHVGDVYSMGVVLYELLTGDVPFPSDNPTEVMQAHIERAPEALSARNPRVPAALSDLVLKALQKAPADRYRDCGEFARQIEWLESSWRTGQPRAAEAAAQAAAAAAATPRAMPAAPVHAGQPTQTFARPQAEQAPRAAPAPPPAPPVPVASPPPKRSFPWAWVPVAVLSVACFVWLLLWTPAAEHYVEGAVRTDAEGVEMPNGDSQRFPIWMRETSENRQLARRRPQVVAALQEGFALRLRMENGGALPLSVTGADYQLMIGDRMAGEGVWVAPEPVRLPATVSVPLGVRSAGDVWERYADGSGQFPLHVKLTVRARTLGIHYRLPLDVNLGSLFPPSAGGDGQRPTALGEEQKAEERKAEEAAADGGERAKDVKEAPAPTASGVDDELTGLADRPGSLQIDSQPAGAMVFVNSELVGNTPLVLVRLRPGRYAVKVATPGFVTRERTIELPATGGVAWRMTLAKARDIDFFSNLASSLSGQRAAAGWVSVSGGEPGAAVWVDGQRAALTPCTLAFRAPGNYVLRVVSGGRALERVVQVTPGTRQTWRIE